MSSPKHPLEVTMQPDIYDLFNSATTQAEGMSLEELAQVRPTDAYRRIARMIEYFAERGATTEETVREIVQDPDIEAIDVIISVFQDPESRGRIHETRQILAFRVEPPNLAF